MGSSPLARGLPPSRRPPTVRGRIIPARAGFTPSSPSCRPARWDHPRSRGVYPTRPPQPPEPLGSSPLARGLPVHLDAKDAGGGIIPARAGFTPPRRSAGPSAGDHPRSRGVYLVRTPRPQLEMGSSPLARGLLSRVAIPTVPRWIIPARAGFTSTHPKGNSNGTDHPRSRGVYATSAPTPCRPNGSSPLARGLPVHAHRTRPDVGIIPARAGFTLADPWNPNEPVLYQTPAAFTADPGPAPPSCGSAVVVPRWTTTPSGA